MTIDAALRALMRLENLKPVDLAAAARKTEWTAQRWIDGTSEPKIGDVLRIKQKFPRFGSLLDEVAA